MHIALAQINLTLGDFEGNHQKILDYCTNADKDGADIVVFPELAISGYNPEDLVSRPAFVATSKRWLDKLVSASNKFNTAIVVGSVFLNPVLTDDEIRRAIEAEHPDRAEPSLMDRLKALDSCLDSDEVEVSVDSIAGRAEHKPCNASFFIHKGHILHQHDKIALPNYGIFDEKRTFAAGKVFGSIRFKDYIIGMLVCEDIWVDQIYTVEPCDLIIVLNSSQFVVDKYKDRLELLRRQAHAYQADIIYLNAVGGQDAIVYDGGSMVVTDTGQLLHQSVFFEESMDIVPLYEKTESVPPTTPPNDEANPLTDQNTSPTEEQKDPEYDNMEHIYQALTLALRDYLRKNDITDVVLGLSGGIDSALTAVIAIDALGKDKVHLVTLPSRYSSTETHKDSKELLTMLGTEAMEISIEPMFEASLKSLQTSKHTEENLQARIRGLLLMALSNEHGYMLLSTGNKSELAVGYATLYGDMNGGYNLLKDLYKTDVYNLAKWRNARGLVIPESIMTKAPTAELSPSQKDSDTLPEYEVLDRILMSYIEEGKSRDEIVRHCKVSANMVDTILKLVKMAEFKRNQATLGPKIRNMSFDLDWRMPVTNRFIY